MTNVTEANARIYVFRRRSPTTGRENVYEAVAMSEVEAREKLTRRFGEQIAREATLTEVQ